MRFRVLLFTLLIAGTAAAQNREPAFKDGEKLTFVVSYRAALVPNTEAAEVTFKTTKTTVGSTPAYHIHANAKVFSFFKWFYDLDDTYQTWLDANTMKPLKFSSRLKEGKYRYKADYVYDWKNRVVNTTYRNLKRPDDKHKTMKLTDKSMDALAIFYNLRNEDNDSFVAGKGLVLELLLDDTIRRINYKFLARENKTIRGMGTFKTLKFSCSLATSTGESFEDGSEFFLWISDDRNKIPLYIESPIKVGSIHGKISKYENLKYPLASKIK